MDIGCTWDKLLMHPFFPFPSSFQFYDMSIYVFEQWICIFILHEYVLKTKYPFPQLRSFVEALNPITTIFGDKDIMEL